MHSILRIFVVCSSSNLHESSNSLQIAIINAWILGSEYTKYHSNVGTINDRATSVFISYYGNTAIIGMWRSSHALIIRIYILEVLNPQIQIKYSQQLLICRYQILCYLNCSYMRKGQKVCGMQRKNIITLRVIFPESVFNCANNGNMRVIAAKTSTAGRSHHQY